MAIAGRRERKLVRTRDSIAKAAVNLFDSRGYEQTSMEEIAEAADVAKGTLYNHFSSKEAVLAHSIHLQLSSDLENLDEHILAHPSFRARLSTLLEASALWCESHRAYLPPYIRYEIQRLGAAREDPPAVEKELVGVYVRLIQAAQSRGEIRSDLAPYRLATVLHYLYFASLLRWLTIDGVDLREEFATIIDLFINGASQKVADLDQPARDASKDALQTSSRRGTQASRRTKPRSGNVRSGR